MPRTRRPHRDAQTFERGARRRTPFRWRSSGARGRPAFRVRSAGPEQGPGHRGSIPPIPRSFVVDAKPRRGLKTRRPPCYLQTRVARQSAVSSGRAGPGRRARRERASAQPCTRAAGTSSGSWVRTRRSFEPWRHAGRMARSKWDRCRCRFRRLGAGRCGQMQWSGVVGEHQVGLDSNRRKPEQGGPAAQVEDGARLGSAPTARRRPGGPRRTRRRSSRRHIPRRPGVRSPRSARAASAGRPRAPQVENDAGRGHARQRFLCPKQVVATEPADGTAAPTCPPPAARQRRMRSTAWTSRRGACTLSV